MGLFDDITGGISAAAGKAADIGKKAAGGIAREAKLDVSALATGVKQGGNQYYQLPGAGTIKGAFSGDPGDIAKVGIAAAVVIPAGKLVGALKFAPEAAGEERGISSMARSLSSETGWLKSSEGSGKLTSFPDSVTNMARRVKTTVMGAIGGEGAGLEGKIASTAKEIERMGGTAPVGPFAGATAQKLSLVQDELRDLPVRDAGAAKIKTDFENNRITDFAKAAAKKALKGGEQGWIRAGSLKAAKGGQEVSVLRFGKGTFPGEGAIGEAPKAGFYEAHLIGGKSAGAVNVAWFTKHGNAQIKDLQPEVTAVSRGLKARGITAIEHSPLTKSRSRLFGAMLKGSGFKNIDRHAPDIRRAGWGVR